jgi:hypothetical protein
MDQSDRSRSAAQQLGLDCWPTCGRCGGPVRQIDKAPGPFGLGALSETWTVSCHGETVTETLVLSVADALAGARVCELLPFQSSSSAPIP